jgi:hypothetical protein
MSAAAPSVESNTSHRRWTREMRELLLTQYAAARAANQLRELAARIGVDLYQLYGQAHRMGLSREIRRR